MKILIIGAAGQLGSDLVRNNPGHQLVTPSRAELDITHPGAAASAVRESAIDWVVNTAAFHNVPQCEQQPEEAFRVNCVAVRDLAFACAAREVRLMIFSTDYVFSGDKRTPYLEDDRPRPLQVYGITKLAGELTAAALAPEHAVTVRTCGLYGRSGASSKGGNFVDGRIKDGRRGDAFEMGCDQTVSPTSTDDLSRAVYRMLEHPRLDPGVYHLVNEGECTWFEFTCAIFDNLGIQTPVRPVDRQGRSGEMRRPLYSVLENSRARALGITLPSWQDALKRYLQSAGSGTMPPTPVL